MVTIRLSAKKYEDHDDCLTAAANDIAELLSLAGWNLSPRWADEKREEILIDVPEGIK